MSFWQNRRVVVSGGHGFLGSFVVEKLLTGGVHEIIVVPRSREYDLREKSETLAALQGCAAGHLYSFGGGRWRHRRKSRKSGTLFL